MRLIDVNVLMTDVRNTITEKSRAFDWINLINRQPTAYDVDKVVERLEEEKKRAFKLCLGTNDSTQRLKYIEKEQTIALAIEIVKGGGVE